MNIVVHYPQDPVKQQELKEKVAAVHSSAISKYIERLPCSWEQKKDLISQLIEEQKKGTAE